MTAEARSLSPKAQRLPRAVVGPVLRRLLLPLGAGWPGVSVLGPESAQDGRASR
jgi:hypothetical protein